MTYHQYNSVEATSTVKTLLVPETANDGHYVELQAENGPIRYTMDGSTTPTQTYGMVLLETSITPMLVSIADLKNMQFCRGSGSNATLHLHYTGGRAIVAAGGGGGGGGGGGTGDAAIWQNGEEIEWQDGTLKEWQ